MLEVRNEEPLNASPDFNIDRQNRFGGFNKDENDRKYTPHLLRARIIGVHVGTRTICSGTDRETRGEDDCHNSRGKPSPPPTVKAFSSPATPRLQARSAPPHRTLQRSHPLPAGRSRAS